MNRCPWGTADELYIRYHDEEWGVPVYDENNIISVGFWKKSWLKILIFYVSLKCESKKRIREIQEKQWQTSMICKNFLVKKFS